MSRYDLVVIGGGSAGLVVAGGAAQLGARVGLVEKKALGGDCLYTGCVPSKTFIRSARFAADVRRASQFGFRATALDFTSGEFAAITDRVAKVIETVAEHDRPERFEAWGVEVIFASPRFLSPRELELTFADGSTTNISAKRFCISTGSRPAIPPVEGLKETTFTDPEIARVGLTEKEAIGKFGATNVHVYRAEFAANDRAQAEDETRGFAKIVCTGRKNEIVGAHIVGAHAGELIHEVVLAMKQRLSINALGSMIHVYPTLTQVNQQAGLDAILKGLAGYKKWLSYYFKVWR